MFIKTNSRTDNAPKSTNVQSIFIESFNRLIICHRLFDLRLYVKILYAIDPFYRS